MKNNIFSFSSVSIDLINNNVFLGGPPNYGGSILHLLSNNFNLNFINISNISKKDFYENIILLKHIIPNYVPETVCFNLKQFKNNRVVKLNSKPFRISSNLNLNLTNATIIVSPIINEFNILFFKKIFSQKPKFIFLDLFNNDDGGFKKQELLLLKQIIALSKKYFVKVFFKLSDKEYFGLDKNILENMDYILLTKGCNGADILKNNVLFFSDSGYDVIEKSSVGAGDVFLYSFVGYYLKKASLKKSLKFANKIASSSVMFNTFDQFYLYLNKKINKGDFFENNFK
ncbi:MAG: hypothetical protein PHX47_02025 [Candidatus ainarchaeum sp.]|jgi:hypothetical protein|nr:hypothetical protein [Candidatus ainarchaeum sp.]